MKDLYDAIEQKNYPTWTAYLQIMDPKEAETYRYNIFDMTKIWPHADYPLVPFGKLILNENVCTAFQSKPLDFMLTAYQPQNHFAEIEQAAFSPSTMVPGIEPSADPSMYQSRISVKISLTIDSASSQDVQLPRCTALSPWGQLSTATDERSTQSRVQSSPTRRCFQLQRELRP